MRCSVRPAVRASLQRVLQRLAVADPVRVWHALYKVLRSASTQHAAPPAGVADLALDPLRLFEVDRPALQRPAFLALYLQAVRSFLSASRAAMGDKLGSEREVAALLVLQETAVAGLLLELCEPARPGTPGTMSEGAFF